jgi:hypothetical protein
MPLPALPLSVPALHYSLMTFPARRHASSADNRDQELQYMMIPSSRGLEQYWTVPPLLICVISQLMSMVARQVLAIPKIR